MKRFSLFKKLIPASLASAFSLSTSVVEIPEVVPKVIPEPVVEVVELVPEVVPEPVVEVVPEVVEEVAGVPALPCPEGCTGCELCPKAETSS